MKKKLSDALTEPNDFLRRTGAIWHMSLICQVNELLGRQLRLQVVQYRKTAYARIKYADGLLFVHTFPEPVISGQ